MAVITDVPALKTLIIPFASTLATLAFDEENVNQAGAAITTWSIPVGILKETLKPPKGKLNPFTADSVSSSPSSIIGFI